MDPKELRGLQEAYLDVYQEIDEAMSSYDRNRQRAAQRAAARNEARAKGQTGNVPGVGYVTSRKEKETYTDESGTERHKTGGRMPKNEEADLYDLVLSHLLDEGYADTYEAAERLMVNMSEDWRESILDEAFKEIDRAKHGRMYDRYKNLRTAAMKDAEETGEASGANRSKMGKMSSVIDKSAQNLRNKG